jgi:toxin CptA
MQKNYSLPLQLTLNRSKRLTNFIKFIHVLALAACVMNSLPVIVKCVLLLAISSHFYFQLNGLKSQPYTIKHSETLGWELAEANNFVAIQILPSTVISIFAVFLQFQKENKAKHSLVILSDALTEDDYRRLIVKLKTTDIYQHIET